MSMQRYTIMKSGTGYGVWDGPSQAQVFADMLKRWGHNVTLNEDGTDLAEYPEGVEPISSWEFVVQDPVQ